MFPDHEEAMLRKLIKAEDDGKPHTFRSLGDETRGSTFEDLFGDRRIVVKGKENVLWPLASLDSELIATPEGRWWVAEREAKREGKEPPPRPKSSSDGVYLFG